MSAFIDTSALYALLVRTERARVVAPVNEGLADAEAERVRRHAELVKRVRTRFGGR